MTNKRRTAGFTLIELLVVVAIIALLISILLPSLQLAREQGKRAVCLANIKGIGTSMQAYATEDKKEFLIPVQQMMVRNIRVFWLWRTAKWFIWGGRDGQVAFDGKWLTSGPRGEKSGGDKPAWGATSRPLNRYVYNDIDRSDQDNMPMYRCPSDTGYVDHPDMDDGPKSMHGIPLYDSIGNSYRGSLYGFHRRDSTFTMGPWAHRVSTLVNTARLILFGEPNFFNMIGKDDGNQNPDAVLVTGWHKKPMVDNLGFTDGSARSTRADGHGNMDAETARKMRAVGGLISRGPKWQIDCYPTPGARLFGSMPEQGLGSWYRGNEDKWPFAGYQRNAE